MKNFIKDLSRYFIATLSIAIIFIALLGMGASALYVPYKTETQPPQKQEQNTLTFNNGFSDNQYVIIGGKAYRYAGLSSNTSSHSPVAQTDISFIDGNTIELFFIESNAITQSASEYSNIVSVLQATKTNDNIKITITDLYDSVKISTSLDASYTLGELALSANAQLDYENESFVVGSSNSATSLTAATTKNQAQILYITSGSFNFSGQKTYSPKNGTIGRAFYQSGGILTLTDIVLDGFSYEGSGGAIYMSGGTLNANGTIKNCKATSGNGGAIFCSGGTINMTSGVIGSASAVTAATSTAYSNYASSNGGGIALSNAATLNISGTAAIGYNCGAAGGGIFSSSTTDTININGGNVKHNYSRSGSGGGIYTYGQVTMTSGTIAYNVANTYGGGLMLKESRAEHSISGGVFNYNKTETYEGGGIRCDGTTTFSGSVVIKNNTSKTNGGGISAAAQTTFTAGTVEKNTAGTNGGGIHISNASIISGGTFKENTANSDGGGIYVNAASTIGGATIQGNSAVNGGAIYKNAVTTFKDCTLSGNKASMVAPDILLSSSQYIILTTSLSNTYNVFKDGLTSYDDSTANSSVIAYSTNATYLTTAKSKLSVTNLLHNQHLVTNRKDNYLVCEWSTYYLAINPDNSTDEYYNETTYGAYIATAKTFNGTNDYKVVGREYMFTDKITINVWAYMTSWAAYANNMRIYSCTDDGGWSLDNSGNKIQFTAYDQGVGYKVVNAGREWASLASGWHMFTMTFDGQYARAYIDGRLHGTSEQYTSGKLGYNATNAIFIGAEAGTDAQQPTGSYFNGQIQDFTIVHDSFYQAEIEDIYAAGRGKIIVSKDYLETYTLDAPTKLGYTFNSWSLSNSGSVLNGKGSNNRHGFNYTNNTYHEKFTVSVAKPSTSAWYYINWPKYAFTAGHTYKLTYKIKINQIAGINFTVRFARNSNDWYTGIQCKGYSAVTDGWETATLTTIFNASFSANGTTTTTAPLIEIYTSDLSKATTSAIAVDFDIKDIVVYDTNTNVIVFASDTSYLFGNSNNMATAQWTANQYQIAFNGNGSTSGSMQNQTHTYDTSLALTANTFSKTGYTFNSWNTKSDGSGVKYTNSQSVKNLASNQGAVVNLYAQWDPNKYTVVFNGNGATSGTMQNQTFTYDSAQNLAENAFKREYTVTYNANSGSVSPTSATAAYTFTYWNPNANGAGPNYANKASVTNLATGGTFNLYAQWQSGSVTLPTPTKTGYVFTGWYTAASGGNSIGAAGASYTPTANITIYAHWVADTYTLTFDGNKPSNASNNVSQTAASKTVTYNSTSNLTSNYIATLTGWTFKGYYTAKSAGTQVFTSAGAIVASVSGFTNASKQWVGTQDKTVYAQWTANTYTVTYNPNSGTVSPTTQTKTYDSAYGTMPTPTKAGYTFLGWNHKNLLDLTKTITAPVYTTLVNAHTLSFEVATTGNTINVVKIQTYLNNKIVEQVFTTSRLGLNTYTFTKTSGFNQLRIAVNGSKTDSNYVVDISHLTNDTQYTISFYLTAFNSAACTATISQVMIEQGSSYTSFQPYYLIEQTIMKTAGNHTLTAGWRVNTYEVVFNGNGATSGSMENQVHTYDKSLALTPNAYSKTGHTFEGWATSATGSVAYADKASVTNLATSGIFTLFAQWKPITYNVAFNGNGNTGGSMENQTHTYDVELELTANAYTKTGYSFNSWNTKTDGSGTKYTNGQKVKNLASTQDTTVTIYAQWTPNTYSVVFNGNGNTGGSMSNQTHTYDKELALTANAFTRTYVVTYNANGGSVSPTTATATYSFAGWNTKTDASGTSYADKAKVKNLATSGTFNLYAKWNVGGVTLPTPTLTGYSCTGWYTAASGGTKVGSVGASYTPTAATTIYAQWEPSVYEVTLDNQGATTAGTTSVQATYKSPMPSITVPSKTGYAFKGYYSNTSAIDLTSSTTLWTSTCRIELNKTGNGWELTTAGDKGRHLQISIDVVDSSLTTAPSLEFNDIGISAYYTKTAITNGWRYFVDFDIAETMVTVRGGYSYDTSLRFIDIEGIKNTSTTVKVNYAVLDGKKYYSDTGTSMRNWDVAGNATLYAKWVANTYEVAFNGNGSTSGSMSNQTHTYDKELALSANAYQKTYLVTYNANGGTVTLTSAIATYSFAGWALGSAGAVVYADKATVKNLAESGTVTLYARWNAGSVKLPDATRTGYTFGGWWTAASGGTSVGSANASYTPTAATTLYAHWTAITYEVAFNGNGHTGGSMQNQTHTYDTSLALTANAYTKKGYTFTGWATSASGAVAYNDKASVKNLRSTAGTYTLYAKWKINQYYLAINPDNTTDEYYNETTYGAYIETAGTFNGTSTFKTVSRNYMFTDKITVNVWANMSSWAAYANNMRIYSCTDGGGWNLENSGNKIQFAAYDQGVGYKVVNAGREWASLASGWHMFTMTFDGQYVRAYIDGRLYGTSEKYTSGKLGYNATNAIFIGAEAAGSATTPDSGYYFNGQIQDFTILNDTMLESEISNIYSAGRGKIIVSKDYLETYALNAPTRTGYTFVNWSLSGSGSILAGQGSSLQSGFILTNNTYHENFSFSVAKPTSNNWYCVRWPQYTFTAGHSYTLSYKIKVNTLTGTAFTMRFARTPNDYFGCASKAYTATTNGWQTHSITQTLNATFSASGTDKTTTPLVEIYTENLYSGTTSTLAVNFDIKDIVVYDNSTNTIVFASNTSYLYSDGNGTATATWKANTYSVAFNGNGSTGGSMQNQTHTYGTSKALTANAYTKTGHTFNSWNTKSDGSGTKYTNGQSVLNLASSQGATVTLYAQWTVNTYNLYISKGQTQLLTDFEMAKPETLEGYNSTIEYKPDNGGTWKLIANNTSDPHSTIPQTVNLTQGKQYYIHMTLRDTNGNLITKTNALQLFIAINFDYNEANSVRFSGDSTATYTAPATGLYNLRMDNDNNGATIVITNFWIAEVATKEYEVVQVKYGQTHNLGTPSRTGYDFNGWVIANGSGSINSTTFTMGSGDSYVTSTFKHKTYVVNIQPNNSSYGNVSSSSIAVPYGAAIQANGTQLLVNGSSVNATIGSASGYTTTFVNWTNAAGSEISWEQVKATYTATANFNRVANTYTLTWNGNATAGDLLLATSWNYAGSAGYTSSNGGNYGSYTKSGVTATSNITYNTTASYKIPIPIRRGYTFNGWYTATSAGTKVADNAGNLIASVSGYTDASKKWIKAANTTLYAQWTITTYNVTVNNNGGTGSSNTTYTTASGATINAPTRTGYTFTGWNVVATLAKVNPATINFDTGVQEYNGTYSSAVYYELFYIKSGVSYTTTLSGGEVRWRSFNASTGAYIQNLDTVTTRDGNDTNIAFWYHLGNSNATITVSFSAGAAAFKTADYKLTGHVSLTASWSQNVYKVTLDNQSATTAGTAEYYYLYNTTKTINNVTCYYFTTSACTTGLTNGYYITCPTKNGYTFGGYYTATGGGGTQYVDSSGQCVNNLYKAMAQHITLYAKWTANKIHLTFDKSGGTGGTNEVWYYYNTNTFYSDANCTTTISVLSLPTKTGYTFVHYYGDGTCGGSNGERYAGHEYVNQGFSADLCYDIYKDATLYALWNANTIHITLDKGGGTGGTNEFWYKYNTATYYSDSACTTVLSTPIAPTKAGYTFLDYHGDGTCGGGNGERYALYDGNAFAGDLHYDIYKDATLYASWQINGYTLRVNTGANNLFNLAELAVSKTDYQPTDAHNAKYSYNAQTMKFTYTASAAADPYVPMHITANLTAGKTYYLHLTALNTDGSIPTNTNWGIFWALTSASFVGEQYFDVINVDGKFYGDCIGSFTAPTTGTYKFRLDQQSNIAGTWEISNLWIGESSNFTTESISYGGTKTLTTPTWAGHTFKGWKVIGSGSISGNTYTIGAGNTAITAMWEANAYTVTIQSNNTNYGTVSKSSVSAVYGAAVSSSGLSVTIGGETVTATKKDAAGYNTTLTWSNASGSITANRTITATFTRSGKTITVTLDKQSGSGGSLNIVYDYGTNSYKVDGTTTSTITLPTRVGYAFNGYYTGTGGTGTQYISNTGAITNNLYTYYPNGTTLTLYASWNLQSYTIMYDTNSGILSGTAGTNYTTSYNITSTITLPSTTYIKRAGYTFGGWEVTSAAGNWTANSIHTSSVSAGKYGNITLTAKWSVITYTVVINYNFTGLTNPANRTISYGSSFTINHPGNMDYYKFLGWEITGMDSSTHIYGENASNTQTTTDTSISQTKATYFKDLRVSSGTVTFTAQWKKSDRTITFNYNVADQGDFDVKNVSNGNIQYYPTYTFNQITDAHNNAQLYLSYNDLIKTATFSITDGNGGSSLYYSVYAETYQSSAYEIYDVYVYNNDIEDGWYLVAGEQIYEGMLDATISVKHNYTITVMLKASTPTTVTLVAQNATQYDGYFLYNNQSMASPFEFNTKVGALITIDSSMINIGGESILAQANLGTCSGWSVSSGAFVTANMTITAYFTAPTYTLTFTVNSASLGSVSHTSITNVAYGTELRVIGSKITIGSTTITATPKGSATFKEWSTASTTITSDMTIIAKFATSGGLTPEIMSVDDILDNKVYATLLNDAEKPPQEVEVWLDDKFRKLQEIQPTEIDFEGISFST